MQSKYPYLFSMDSFGNGEKFFWIEDFQGLLERYPFMEFLFRPEFYILLYVEDAAGHIAIDDNVISLDSTKIIRMTPNCLSSLKINRQAKGKMICFTKEFFTLSYSNNILGQFIFLKRDSKPFIRLDTLQNKKIGMLVNLLVEEFNVENRESLKVIRSYLNILLFEFERIYNPVGYFGNKDIKQEKIQFFEELIDKHFDTHKMPSTYAELLNISPNYLNKICKEVMGITAGDLIRKRIIIEAQKLLYHTSLNVSEIADKLGFENLSYFVTFFKKYAGYTPDQYRKKQY